MYRTAPLAGLWSHQKGGFYHDGRFATLKDIVDHYNDLLKLGLTERERADLIEYLKSLLGGHPRIEAVKRSSWRRQPESPAAFGEQGRRR